MRHDTLIDYAIGSLRKAIRKIDALPQPTVAQLNLRQDAQKALLLLKPERYRAEGFSVLVYDPERTAAQSFASCSSNGVALRIARLLNEDEEAHNAKA